MTKLTKNIGEYFGNKSLGKREVGIEIEIEANNNLPTAASVEEFWEKERDGSLRGARNGEFVLVRPMSAGLASLAISQLIKQLEERRTDRIDSGRAGVHVHINVNDLTFLQMYTFVTCWYVVEELLTKTICGKDRAGNLFCLQAMDATVVLDKIQDSVTSANIRVLDTQDIRYCALNLTSLFKYGSLEFRAMKTPDDLNEIKTWMKILLSIKKESKLYKTPKDVIKNFSLGGYRTFLNNVLGNMMAQQVICLDPDGWESCMKRGMRLAQDIAYCSDWKDRGGEKEIYAPPEPQRVRFKPPFKFDQKLADEAFDKLFDKIVNVEEDDDEV